MSRPLAGASGNYIKGRCLGVELLKPCILLSLSTGTPSGWWPKATPTPRGSPRVLLITCHSLSLLFHRHLRIIKRITKDHLISFHLFGPSQLRQEVSRLVNPKGPGKLAKHGPSISPEHNHSFMTAQVVFLINFEAKNIEGMAIRSFEPTTFKVDVFMPATSGAAGRSLLECLCDRGRGGGREAHGLYPDLLSYVTKQGHGPFPGFRTHWATVAAA